MRGKAKLRVLSVMSFISSTYSARTGRRFSSMQDPRVNSGPARFPELSI